MATALARIKFQRKLGKIYMQGEKDYQHVTGNSQACSARILGLPRLDLLSRGPRRIHSQTLEKAL